MLRLLLLLPILMAETRSGQDHVHAANKAEYCQFEEFNAECGENEVIVMTSARYGRMKLGRCVTADLGYVGCSADVLDIADRKCSGKRRCSIRIPDQEFTARKPCLKELTFYLEASYKCIPVSSVNTKVCTNCDYVKLVAPSGTIASATTEDTGCGSPDCPWIIEAKRGQRLNITLMDFNLADQTHQFVPKSGEGCRVYATIKELRTKRSTTVCSGRAREMHVYTSVGNALEVRVVGRGGSDNPGRFLLHYQALECPDLPTPSGGFFRRYNTHALIGCNSTGESWRLTCENNQWKGRYSNCTGGQGLLSDIKLGSVTLPSGVSIMIILAVAIFIGVMILALGLLLLRRNRHNLQKGENQYKTRIVHGNQMDGEFLKPMYEAESNDNLNNLEKQHRGPGQERNEYAHIWEMPLPQPAGRGSDLTERLSISPYDKQQQQTQGNYVTYTGHHQPYGNNTMARREYEATREEEDPRYFQLDPDGPPAPPPPPPPPQEQ